MLPAAEPIKETVGVRAADATVRDHCIQRDPSVPDADVPDDVVEDAWLDGRTQALGLVLGEVPGLDHPVEPPHETVPSSPPHLALGVRVHVA
jgi:hypothetical protein